MCHEVISFFCLGNHLKLQKAFLAHRPYKMTVKIWPVGQNLQISGSDGDRRCKEQLNLLVLESQGGFQVEYKASLTF